MPSLRLLAAASALGGLVLTGLSPAPAQAAVPITDGTISLSGDLNYNSTNCPGTSAPTDVEAAFTAGTTVKRTLTFDRTATAADPTDSARFRGSQALTVSSTASGSQVTSLTVTSTVTGSVDRTKAASACDQNNDDFPVGASNQAEVRAQLHRSTAGWLHVRATSTGVGGQILMAGFGGGSLVETQTGGFAVRDISHDSWVYVPAGDNFVELQLGGASVDNFGLDKISMKQSVKLTFHPAGVARAAATGTARPMVTLPTYLTCSTGKANVRLTSRISGVDKVHLYVNGVRKTTLVRPRSRAVTLSGVPKNRSVTLKAVVVDGRRTYSAARSHRSC